MLRTRYPVGLKLQYDRLPWHSGYLVSTVKKTHIDTMGLLAPYTNAMRLGQGFNSYTQQICLDQAVTLPDPKKDAKPLKPVSDGDRAIDHDEPIHTPQDSVSLFMDEDQPPETRTVKRVVNGQSQIVTYSAKFVEKLSDITGACICGRALCDNRLTVPRRSERFRISEY